MSIKTPQADEELEDYTFRNAFRQRKSEIEFLWQKKVLLVGFTVIGCLLGVGLALLWPVSYTARTTFVVEEGKSGGGGGLMSSLAGSLGMDLGSLMGGTSGVLAGDNVQQLLVSQRMLKETILTPLKDGASATLADKYAETYKLDTKWAKYNNGNKILFPADPTKYTRLQDSLLLEMLRTISEKHVSVNKPDKKLGFFALNATTKDEMLASLFCTRLLDIASQFYIKTKTKRLRTNVERLQFRADSLERLLNRKTYSSSVATGPLLDLNPAYATAGVASEVQERDKRLMATAYSEIFKNLEVSRTMLMQETPTFQIVDIPELPIRKNRLKYSTAGMAGAILAGIAGCIIILLRRNKRSI